MMRKLLIGMILIGFTLAGCQAAAPAIESTREGKLSELPPTWTAEPTSSPQPARTDKSDSYPSGTTTATPTPVFIPPTPTREAFVFPTYTHAIIEDLPPLIKGKDVQITELPSTANQLFYLNPQIGFAMGKDHYKTINGGADWINTKTVSWDGQFSFINDSDGWVIARRDDQIALLHTVDGGQSYQEIRPIIAP